MITSKSGGRFRGGPAARRSGKARAWRSHRGVSDVVATILLLGLTVTLFASIFAFVTSFPSPPAQNSNQFQATLTSGPNASSPGHSMVTAINILHLAGPAVLQYTLIYVKSSTNPKGPEFQSPYTLAQGGIPSGTVWNLGQTWVLVNFTSNQHPALPDNLTIYIVSGSALLFSVVVPGQVISPPPTFLAVGTSPNTPVVGGPFVISALISGVGSGTPMITVSGLPGAFPAGAVAMTASSAPGLWTYSVPAGMTTASGSFYAFITALSASSKSATSSVPVGITAYTTLISSVFTVTSAPAQTKCANGHTLIANGCKEADYIYTVPITVSAVTFGSVLFEVLKSTGSAYSPTTVASFSIVNSSTGINRAYYSMSATSTPFVMTSTTPFTYVSPIVSTSPLTPGFYQIIIDTGATTTSWTGQGYQFVVIGQGAYFGTTPPVSLP
jgi:hypothetical protein